jgi:hypothetical protein
MYVIFVRFNKSNSTKGFLFWQLLHSHESLFEFSNTLSLKNSPWNFSFGLKGAQHSITYPSNHRECLKWIFEENAQMGVVINLWELQIKNQTITFLVNGNGKLPWLYQLPMMGVVKYIIICLIFQGNHYTKYASWASITYVEATWRLNRYVPNTHNVLTTKNLFDLFCIIILNLHTIMNNVYKSNPPTPKIKKVSGAFIGYWTHIRSW